MAKGMVGGPSQKEMAEYQAESDLRTLVEAAKIKKDKARCDAAMKKHKEMMAALHSVKAEKEADTKGMERGEY